MENGGKKNDEFLRETVTRRSAGRRRAGKIAGLIAGAVAFGLIACLTFVLVLPRLEPRVGRRDPEAPEETISFPEETEAETVPQTEAPQEGTEPETEPVPTATERIANANSVIVRVRADGSEGTAGFLAGETETAGLLFSSTSSTAFLLADYSVMDGCTSFVVTLRSGTETAGTLRGADTITGLAVIGIDLAVADHAGLTGLFPDVSWSGTLRPGDGITAVGSPYGAVYSGSAGQVVFHEAGIPAEDGAVEIVYTDLSLSGSAFLLNEEGDLVGISTRALQQSGSGSFYGISALRSDIERLANGREIARLGVIAAAGTYSSITQDPTEEAVELPRGAVVETVILDSPAFESGIQAGDIIAEIGGAEVYDLPSLQQALLSATAHTETEVAIYRQSRDGYAEQVFTVTLGAR